MKMISTTQTSFTELISRSMYIDKTKPMLRVIKNYDYVFASRPRRFGKSVTLSAFAEIFKGNKELFKDLAIYNSAYDWKEYPVLSFSFSSINAADGQSLRSGLMDMIYQKADGCGIKLRNTTDFTIALSDLLEKLKRSVVLVDEYDTPIIKRLLDKDKLSEVKEVLRDFFAVLKDSDSYLRFVYITGITKFAKLSLFSSMNNLEDISMNPDYADLFGFTESELEEYFDEYIDDGAVKTKQTKCEYLSRIRGYYDGYRFTSSDLKVYNPISINSFFKTGKGIEFERYWNATGNSTLAYYLTKLTTFDIMEGLPIALTKSAIDDYIIEDITKINKEEYCIFLFQAGILTVSDYKDGYYYFNFPNTEVKEGFIEGLARSYMENDPTGELYRYFNAGNTKAAIDKLQKILIIPYDDKEGAYIGTESYYHNALNLIFNTSDMKKYFISEERTNSGKADFVLRTENTIYIIEIKVDQSAKVALRQIREKGYADKFRDDGRKIHLVGINISSTKKTIEQYKEEILR